MAAPRSPIFRATFYAEHYPSSGGTDTLYFSTEEHTDPDPVEGRVSEFGAIDRGISDANGEHFVAQATVTFDDNDHYFRTRLASQATRYLDGKDTTLEVVSREAEVAGTPRHVLMRGQVKTFDLEDGLGATAAIEELIGAEFGPMFLDGLINPRKFGELKRLGIAPALDTALEEQHIPLGYGEKTDVGRKYPDGTSAEKGTCPGFYIGMFDPTGGTLNPVVNPPLLPPLSAPMTYLKFGSGGSNTYTYAFAVRTTSGGYTTLGGHVTITGLPNPAGFSPTNGVILYADWNQYTAAQQAIIAGGAIFVKDGDASSSAPWHRMDGAGEVFNTSANTPFQAGPNWNSGDIGYEDNGDDSHYKNGAIPSTNTAIISGNTWGCIVFTGHAVASLLALYGSDGGNTGSAPARVGWTLGGMADVLDPFSPSWPFPDPFVDAVGSDGSVHRLFCIFVKGPRLQHHIDKRVTIAANLCLRDENADGSGDTIDQAFFMWQHFLSEDAFTNGYYSGPWVGIPQFGDGTPAISSVLVQAAQALSATLMGTSKGALCGFLLTRPMTKREFLRAFNRNYTSFTWCDDDGAIGVGIVNTQASPTSGTLFREDIDDVVAIGAPKVRRDLLENLIEYEFDEDPDADKFMSGIQKLESTASQTAYGANGRLAIRRREVYSQQFISDAVTANWAMSTRLFLFQDAPHHVPVLIGTHGWNVDLFEQVLLSGHEGVGSSGYSLEPGLIIRHQTIPPDGHVELTVWIFGLLLSRAFGVQSGSTRVWGSGTLTWDSGSQVWG